ncbi:MAG: hypothetical protein Fur0037_18500 [Planctomycetota bacterium]
MESVKEVREALSARSRTATLDELRDEGRRQVRLIKAEQVAAMISEAVHAAIEQSGLIPPEEAERLVQASRSEFQGALRERQEEAHRTKELERQCAEQQEQLQSLRAELEEAKKRLESARGTGAPMAGTQGGTDAGMETGTETGTGPRIGTEAGMEPGAASPQLMMAMMREIASLKASLQSTAQQPLGSPADLESVMQKLSGAINERLEIFGRKMGISSAVEGDEVRFDGLFKDDGATLESNIDNVQVKQKAGGGIGANLAKLKKLKGGN